MSSAAGDRDHRAAFVCPHVFADTHPVLLVVHDGGGDWQFLCGAPGHDDGHVVGLGHLFHRDPSLLEVLDLRDGQLAHRTAIGAPWTRDVYTGD